MKFPTGILFFSLLSTINAYAVTRARGPATAPTSAILQRILNAEDHRLPDDKVILDSIDYGKYPAVTRRAIQAAGRIGSPVALESLNRLIQKRDGQFREQAIFALSLIGGPQATMLLSQHLALHKELETKRALIVALGRCGGSPQLATIAGHLKEGSDPLLYESAALAAGLLFGNSNDQWEMPEGLTTQLGVIASAKSPASLTAAFALSRYKAKTPKLADETLITAIEKTPFSEVRQLLLRALAKSSSKKVADFLVALDVSKTDGPTRIEVVRAMGAQVPAPELLTKMASLLQETSNPVLVQALESVGQWGPGAVTLAPNVETIYQKIPSAWVKGAALKALAKIAPDKAVEKVTALLGAPNSPLYPDATTALASLGTEDAPKRLLEIAQSPHPLAAANAIAALGQLNDDKLPPNAKEAFRAILLKGDVGLGSTMSEVIQAKEWKDFSDTLVAAYAFFKTPDAVEGKVAILKALRALKEKKTGPFLTKALEDPNRLVSLAAAEALRDVTGEDLLSKVPLNTKVTTISPLWQEAVDATRRNVVLTTNRGEIEIRFRTETPLTAFQIVKLVREGFYSNKSFHRVVPRFVTQGGDPRGDGFGGPGYFIRDEVTGDRHSRGTIGIATAGKDTGGSQFFFNVASNLHLAGNYTLFGDVERGMDVVDRLEVGDRILSARVK